MQITDELKQTLYAAVICDALDEIGYHKQALPPYIRPLDESLSFMGRARTGIYTASYEVAKGENPYQLEIKFVDDLKSGEVAVLSCGGPTDRIAPWGELLSTASLARGAAACVTDGLVRDTLKIRKLKFPVFQGGIAPLDSKGRGRMIDMDVLVEVGGVPVRSGDIVFGDADGVVVIPQAVEDETLRIALGKVTAEHHTSAELKNGAFLAEVYAKYGVL